MPDAIPIFKSDEVTLQDALQQTQHGFQGQNFWSCQLYRYDAFRTQIERWLNVMNIFHEITFMGDIRKMQTARNACSGQPPGWSSVGNDGTMDTGYLELCTHPSASWVRNEFTRVTLRSFNNR